MNWSGTAHRRPVRLQARCHVPYKSEVLSCFTSFMQWIVLSPLEVSCSRSPVILALDRPNRLPAAQPSAIPSSTTRAHLASTESLDPQSFLTRIARLKLCCYSPIANFDAAILSDSGQLRHRLPAARRLSTAANCITCLTSTLNIHHHDSAPLCALSTPIRCQFSFCHT